MQIPLDRDTVFKALNDPEILKQSIPGCEELTKKSDNEMDALVVVFPTPPLPEVTTIVLVKLSLPRSSNCLDSYCAGGQQIRCRLH